MSARRQTTRAGPHRSQAARSAGEQNYNQLDLTFIHGSFDLSIANLEHNLVTAATLHLPANTRTSWGIVTTATTPIVAGSGAGAYKAITGSFKMTITITAVDLRFRGMGSNDPTDRDRAEAISRLVSGLARGDDLFQLAAAVEELHPRHNTFPGEVFMYLGADALDLAGVTRDDPIPYLDLRKKYLAECRFRGRDNRKIQFAILAAASGRGGIEPDLLDEVVWWQTDDFWWYALAAAVAVIRACADKTGAPVAAFVQRLSAPREMT